MKIQMKTEPKTAVVYASWDTDILPNGEKLTCAEDGEPLLALFTKEPSNIDIKDLYVDFYRNPSRPQFNALLEACEKNKYDYILIPSLNSLTSDLLSIRLMIEKIKMKSPFTEVYFALEEIYTGSENWQMRISFMATVREETRLLAQRKKELKDIIRKSSIS